ncbi:hypothetical protein ElyMa_002040300 [Elysia marginata]|uniref:Fibronectin type-III domain-containing protein n=1 Tax=Elysia marginata TaxID=1093978 RepID=A0AAV4F7M0_9GAST|nr:hypothetical protein ElyMa_002040300 [Elysia marginata]
MSHKYLTYAGCPENEEIERPRNYVEMISGIDTWAMYGIRISATDPDNHGSLSVNLGSPVVLRVAVQVMRDPQKAPQCIFAYCWTNIKTEDNPCGIWKEIFLPFIPCESSTVHGDENILQYIYQGYVMPINSSTYRVTFLLKWNHLMVWLNDFRDDGFVNVL